MTRYAIDAATALRLIRERPALGAHRLVGPSTLRSDVLALLHRDVREGRCDERAALADLERLAGLKIRLLGDRVSRSRAWRIAMADRGIGIAAAEYLAVAALQADAIITTDDVLRSGAAGIVPVAPFEDLLA